MYDDTQPGPPHDFFTPVDGWAPMSTLYDVLVVGGGPAGSSCAAFSAAAGLRTLLVEREKFPREKVCGDCLNPSVWPVLDRLDLSARVRALPHARLSTVRFVPVRGEPAELPLPPGPTGEIAVKRSLLDALLLARAGALGAELLTETSVTAVARSSDHWEIATNQGKFAARHLVAADGRNSTVARLCGLLPRMTRERLGWQTHVPLPPAFGQRVVLQLLPWGYSGQAPVNERELNLCLVGRPRHAAALKAWAHREFHLADDHPWRTITPLSRAPISPVHEGLFLVGDAARVVEPFTGEGIFYALRSGELAATAIRRMKAGEKNGAAQQFLESHRAIYQGRLWINKLARFSVLYPRTASFFFNARPLRNRLLQSLLARVTAAPAR